MKVRAHAVGFLCALAGASGCAYGTIETDNGFGTGSVEADAATAHDSGHQPTLLDAGSAVDAWQPPPTQDAQVDPPDASARDSSVTCTLDFPSGLATCDTCLETSCCAADNACGTSADCANVMRCYNGCFPTDGGQPDQACLSACDTSYPQGAALLNAYGMCAQNSCMGSCF